MMFGLGRSAPPIIRPLRSDRAEDCARIHAASFAHAWTAEEVANLIAGGAIGAAALDSATGAMRGFVLSRLAADEAEVLTIAVHPSARGRGIGRALLLANFRQAANAGARTLFLEVEEDNGAALTLYRRLGFVRVGERVGYYRRKDGSRTTAAVMRRALP